MTIPALLIECARIQADQAQRQHLRRLAGEIDDWSGLAAEAERHGLGPLTYWHLRAAGAPGPKGVERQLLGLYVRHRHANGVRLRALGQLLRAFQAAGIRVLAVKGAALACLLYPDPALRPMSDLDLLVRARDWSRARGLLAELGYSRQTPRSSTAAKDIEGVWVGVELHTHLFSLTLDHLSAPPLAFELPAQDVAGFTLGYDEMLWHLCRHLRFHAGVFLPWRLIWVTDILGLVERFADQVDWGSLARRGPLVANTLSLLQHLRPLPEGLLKRAGGAAVGLPLNGVGRDFSGWPRYSVAEQRPKGLTRILGDTFCPPEWWLRLHHGLGSGSPLFWSRWVRHPLEILVWAGHLLLGRVRCGAHRLGRMASARWKEVQRAARRPS